MKIINLNNNYSTTRLCYKLLDDGYLDKNGRIKEDLKFKINIPEFRIQNSEIIGKPKDKFETHLFLPECERRKGEGGLRTKGYFKFSYEKKNGDWYISNSSICKKIKNLPITNNQYTNLPLITIITVVYNGEKYLEETIQSVINQTYPDVEYIIIDGGSTDGTLDIIKKYEDKIDYWVSEKDRGIYDGMNKGINVAGGEWINFMNAGDKFYKNSVIEKINFLDDYDLIYGKVILRSNDAYNGRVSGRKVKREDFFFKMPVCHQAIFHKKDVFKKVGKYNTSYKISADHEWVLRFLSNNYDMKFCDLIVGEYLLDGFSGNKLLLSKKEKFLISRRYFSNSSLKASYLYMMLMCRGIGVKILEKLDLLKYYRSLRS